MNFLYFIHLVLFISWSFSLKYRLSYNMNLNKMTINDEIIAIANQLANSGKKPSVALIKTRLTNSVPLPTIISTLKTWHHEPDNTIETNQTVNEAETRETYAPLTKADLQPVYAELAEIKQQLAEVLSHLTKSSTK